MSRSGYRFSLIVILITTFFACKSQPTLREQLAQVAPKHLEFYDFEPSVPLIRRISVAPPELIELHERADGVALKARELTRDQRSQIEDAFGILPARHREVLEDRLIGIYCVENWVGSGMADWVLGPEDKMYAVLILHPRVFETTASELLTLRANTSFQKDDSGASLSIEVSDSISALQYIVLHESTHIVDFVERHTPFVEPAMLELFGRSTRDTVFTDAVWSGYRELASAVDFPFHGQVRFYGLGGTPALTNSDMGSVYDALSATPFASLYGSISWAEDFAEYVTFSYLVHALDVDYAIRVDLANGVRCEYEPFASPLVLRRSASLDPGLFTAPE